MIDAGISFHVSEKGYYGDFGGAFIPEMLYPNVEELRLHYLEYLMEPSFQKRIPFFVERFCGPTDSLI